MIPEVRPSELAKELSLEQPPRLLDVREEDELEISRLPGIVHIPMMELSSRLHELDPKENWVVVCRSGARSADVTAYMLQLGFCRVRNLAGGMNEWATTVDANMRQY